MPTADVTIIPDASHGMITQNPEALDAARQDGAALRHLRGLIDRASFDDAVAGGLHQTKGDSGGQKSI